jgi:hypothetical protein
MPFGSGVSGGMSALKKENDGHMHMRAASLCSRQRRSTSEPLEAI